MKTSSISVVLLALSGVLPILSGCPKKEEPVVFDAAPPPVVSSVEPVDLAPLEDAGIEEEEDADADAGKPKGPGVNINVARVRQCCNAIAAQGKALGASPEGASLMTVAATCNAAAAQLSPSSTGVELAAVRQALKASGKALPGICSGL